MFQREALILCCAFAIINSLQIATYIPTFVVVDPLDEFENTQEVINYCRKIGLRFQAMWSRQIAKALNSDQLFYDDNSADPEKDFNAIDVSPIDLNDKNSCLKWLHNHKINIDAGELIGVISESDTCITTSEYFSDSISSINSNTKNGNTSSAMRE